MVGAGSPYTSNWTYAFSSSLARNLFWLFSRNFGALARPLGFSAECSLKSSLSDFDMKLIWYLLRSHNRFFWWLLVLKILFIQRLKRIFQLTYCESMLLEWNYKNIYFIHFKNVEITLSHPTMLDFYITISLMLMSINIRIFFIFPDFWWKIVNN